MNHFLINIALIYFISATAAATISVFIFKIQFLGSFWGALTIALIGSFIGGSLGSLMPVLISRSLHNFLPSILSAFVFLYVYRWLSVLKEY